MSGLPPDRADAHIAAAAAGDRRALHELLLACLPRVRNLVRYLVQGDDEVEDIAQEALLTMLRSLATYRGDGAFNAWLGQLVARTTFKYVRRRRAARKLADPDLTGSFDDASALVLAGEKFLERRRLVAVLDRLPHEQRQALVLHYVVEMSVPEMAAELQIPLETVRSRLRVGRARLRSLFAAEPEERR